MSINLSASLTLLLHALHVLDDFPWNWWCVWKDKSHAFLTYPESHAFSTYPALTSRNRQNVGRQTRIITSLIYAQLFVQEYYWPKSVNVGQSCGALQHPNSLTHPISGLLCWPVMVVICMHCLLSKVLKMSRCDNRDRTDTHTNKTFSPTSYYYVTQLTQHRISFRIYTTSLFWNNRGCEVPHLFGLLSKFCALDSAV